MENSKEPISPISLEIGLKEKMTKFEDGLKENELTSFKELKQNIESLEKELNDHEANQRVKKAEKIRNELIPLKELWGLFEEIQSTEKLLIDSKQRKCSNIKKLEKKKNEFEHGLQENELANVTDLKQNIDSLEKELKDHEANQRVKKAEKIRNELIPLKELWGLFEDIQTEIDDSHEFSQLRNEYEEGLKENEIYDSEQLKANISKLEIELQSCEEKKKVKKAAEIRTELNKLKKLWETFLKLPNPHQNQEERKNIDKEPNPEIYQLREKVKKELELNNIENEKDLVDTISDLEIKIKDCEEKQFKIKVKKIQSELSVLKNIWNMIEKTHEMELIEKEKKSLQDFLHLISSQKIETFNENFQFFSNMLTSYKITSIEQLNIMDNEQNNEKNTINPDDLKTLMIDMEKVLTSEVLPALNMDLNQLEEQLLNLIDKKELFKEELVQKVVIYLNNVIKFLKFIETSEEIKNLKTDISDYPESIEKSVMKLIYDLSVKILSDPDEISKKIEEIKIQIQNESSENSTIKQIFNEMVLNSSSQDFENLLINLKTLFKKLSPLNINEILRLVKKADICAEKIANQSIILFLGGTGAGKSTTISYLSFCTMKKVSKMCEGKTITHIDVDPNSDQKGCKISFSTKSETRYINPIMVSLRGKLPYHEENIILCDTPGFEDTAGPEVDIANGLGIINSVKGCKAVKIVIVLSKLNVGTRFDKIKDLVAILIGIIPNISAHIRSFDYLYTGFEEKEKEEIIAKMRMLYKQMKEEPTEAQDQTSLCLFYDMMNKSDNLKIVFPLDGKPENIIKQWIAPDCSLIQNCDEAFKFSISQNSKGMIQEHCHLIQRTINSHVKLGNYEVVLFKMNQLKKLRDLLGMKMIEMIYEESVKDIRKFLNGQYETSFETLRKCMKEDNCLTEEDLMCFREAMLQAENAQKLREAHLGNELMSHEYFKENLNQEVDILIDSIKQKNFTDCKIKDIISKIYKISIVFKEFEQIRLKFENISEEMKKKLNDVVGNFSEILLSNENEENKENAIYYGLNTQKVQNNFENCADILSNIYNLTENLESFMTGISEEYKKALKELKTYFENLVFEINKILSNNDFSQQAIEKIAKNLKILEIAQILIVLDRHVRLTFIIDLENGVLTRIMDSCEKIYQNIKEEFDENNNENSLKNLKELLTKMKQLRAISEKVSNKVETAYTKSLAILKRNMEICTSDVNIILKELDEKKLRINYRKLNRGLNYISQAEWMKEYIPNFHHTILVNVQLKIMTYIEEKKDQFLNFDLRFENYEKVSEAANILTEINKIDQAKQLFEEVKNDLKEMNDYFESSVKHIFELIKCDFFDKPFKADFNFDYSKGEAIYLYLGKLTQIKTGPLSTYATEAETNLRELKNCLEKYFDQLEKNFITTLKIFHDFQASCDSLNDNALVLLQILPHFKEIKKKNQLFKWLQIEKKYQNILKSLEDIYLLLKEEIRNHQNIGDNNSLNKTMFNCKILTKLDDFLDNKCHFLSLYNENIEFLYKKAPEIVQKAIGYIQKHEFGNLKQILDQLNIQDSKDKSVGEIIRKNKNDICFELNQNINELTESVTSDIGRINKDTVTYNDLDPILKKLVKIENAKVLADDYIFTKGEKINECLNRAKINLNKICDCLINKIKIEFNSRLYEKAEENLRAIEGIRNCNTKYLPGDIDKTIDSLNQVREESLNSLLKEYENKCFDDLQIDPPKEKYDYLLENQIQYKHLSGKVK